MVENNALKKVAQVSLKSIFLNISLLFNTSWDVEILLGDTCGRYEKLMLDSDYT